MNLLTNEDRLREIIRILIRKFGVLEKSEVECCGVTLAQCHALVEIGRAGTLSLNVLASVLNIDNSTMSRSINNLVERKLVKRELDPKDRRYVTIKLTKCGLELFKIVEQNMKQYYSEVLNVIPTEKKEQVIESFELLLRAIDHVNNNKDPKSQMPYSSDYE